MASLNRENGNFIIQFVGSDGKRRSIRLGKMPKKLADSVRVKVEHLDALNRSHLPIDAETSTWIGAIGDELAGKLAAVGLIAARQSRTLGGYLEAFVERRKPSAKPATMVNLGTVVNDLNAFFGVNADLRGINEERAAEFKTHDQTRLPKLAQATVARRLRTVKMLFHDSVRWKLINVNPFADVSARSSFSEERKHYVTVEDTRKILAVCNPTWRMIVALSRFAGLRCPSEVLSLKWADVNFETNRITASSPKTEHLEGKAYRVMPIFAELRPHLVEAFELAEGGAEYVVGGKYLEAANGPRGWMNCNLRTQLLKIIKRAGLKPWPRLFHNMRSSRETDLMQAHPIHVVTSWLGNTPSVALKHYLQTLDRDFDAAVKGSDHPPGQGGAVVVQKAVQSGTASIGPEATNSAERPENRLSFTVPSSAVVSGPETDLGRLGVEPSSKAL